MPAQSLRIISGAGAGSSIPLTGDFIVGRSESGMGNLAGDSEISRRHARFQQTDFGQVVVEDLGSTNGTLVNGQRLGGPYVLSPADQITIGKTTLQLDGGAPQPNAGAQPAAAPAPAPAFAPPGTPPGTPAPARPRWLIPAIAVTVLVVAGAVVAVIANSGSDSGGSAATKPSASTPAQSKPAPKPSVQSVAQLDRSLKSALSGQSGSGPRVTAVTCPGNAPASAGAKFSCRVQGQQGLSGDVKVTLKDDRRKAYAFKAVLQGNGFTQTVSGSQS